MFPIAASNDQMVYIYHRLILNWFLHVYLKNTRAGAQVGALYPSQDIARGVGSSPGNPVFSPQIYDEGTGLGVSINGGTPEINRNSL